MKFGVRKPSLKRSIKARTTGRLKRSVKKSVNPFYGQKGMGWMKNPKKAAYNNIYHKTSIGALDLYNKTSSKRRQSGTREDIESEQPIIQTPRYKATVWGGWFGLHHYLDGDVILGLIYTFSLGFFLVGWLYDIYLARQELLEEQAKRRKMYHR